MTISTIREMFATDTVINIKSFEEKSPTLTLQATNLLFGCRAFSSIAVTIKSIKATAENPIEITIDIPTQVLEAWKKYSDDYYNNN